MKNTEKLEVLKNDQKNKTNIILLDASVILEVNLSAETMDDRDNEH